MALIDNGSGAPYDLPYQPPYGTPEFDQLLARQGMTPLQIYQFHQQNDAYQAAEKRSQAMQEWMGPLKVFSGPLMAGLSAGTLGSTAAGLGGATGAGTAAAGAAAGGNMSGVLDFLGSNPTSGVQGTFGPGFTPDSAGGFAYNAPGFSSSYSTGPLSGGTDMSGFMGNGGGFGPPPANPALDSLTNLGNSGQLGGGAVNFGTAADPYGMGYGGMTPTGSAGWDSVFSGGANLPAGGPWNDFSLNPYGSGSFDTQSLSGLQKLINGLTGGGGSGGANGGIGRAAGSLAGGIFNPDGSLNLGALGGLAGSVIPGAAALNYANNQPGIDVSGLQGTIGQVGGINTDSQESVLQRMASANPAGSLQDVLARMQATDPAADLRGVLGRADANAPLFVQAATDPVQRNIASGYGALQQSQALRGLGGSSFGDTALANYMDQGNRTLANAGATAAQSALGLQGQLAGNIGTLTNQNLAGQASAAGQAGALQNANLGQQGTLSSSIYNSRLASLLGQGGLQQGLIGLQNTAQKNKNDLFGRAFSAFGRSAGGGLGNGLNLSALGLGG